MFIGLVRVISSFLTTWACGHWGRRRPAVHAAALVAATFIVLTCYLESVHAWPDVVPWSSWVPASCILLNVFSSTVSYSIIPWSMLGEVFPTDVRGVSIITYFNRLQLKFFCIHYLHLLFTNMHFLFYIRISLSKNVNYTLFFMNWTIY